MKYTMSEIGFVAKNGLEHHHGLYTVMSDSEDSMITYTVVSSPFASPSPDYVPGLEYLPSLDFVPEPVYLKFMPPEDDVLPAEEQPLPAALSPTADSPGYVLELDPEEDPKEDDDEDPEENPANYPADKGDDGDDEDESSDDEEDDDIDIEGRSAPNPCQLYKTVGVTRLLSMPHLLRRLSRLRLTSLRPHHHHIILLDIPTPLPSPLSPWSSSLPHIPYPPLPPILSPLPLSPPLHLSSPPTSSPIKSLDRTGGYLTSTEEVGESSSAHTGRPLKVFGE
ncbi:hypothetical protein Tco_1318644 [Tanacetum coccineum]